MNSALQNISSIIQSGRFQDVLFPIGIAASVLVLIMPLPPELIDFLLTINITASVIILLTTIFINRPLDFNVFPSILLATTLFRLVLSVATTRLILANGGELGVLAAGTVIKSFSQFVTGNNIAIGVIIFAIIFIIQFIVITKGATRVSEVAARFTLDAMPGRQMAIDADLNAGIIDEKEAQKRRTEVTSQADFFGAMDGASKFVRGDAIASLIIAGVNILGGLFIGMIEHGMSLLSALDIFTRLTIGDGLVSQVPAFLISVATGMLVTRSSEGVNMPKQVFDQMLSRPPVLLISAAFIFLLSFTGIAKLPIYMIVGACIGFSLLIRRTHRKERQSEEQSRQEQEKAENEQKKEDRVEDYLAIDPMELEIGVGLIPLADPARGGDLLDRIHKIRQTVAAEIGILLPRVRIRDSFQLDQLQYRIKIANNPVASNMVYPDLYLAMEGDGEILNKIQGIATTDPAFGNPAWWIDAQTKDNAELFGYTVVESAAVVATHLTETVRKHADELLTRDATQKLIDELKVNSPALVDDLMKTMQLGQIQQVLQMLLREQVPIRQLGTILETLGDSIGRTRDPIMLCEYARQRLSRTLSTRYRDSEGTLNLVMLDPALEDQIRAGFQWTEQGIDLRFRPEYIDQLCTRITQEVTRLRELNLPLVILVNPQIRPILKRITSGKIYDLVILSYSEITTDTRIESHGIVTM
jgi:flagellar biosynthesis protein FlhA